MIHWLRRFFQPFEPPTDRQQRFAAYLGIALTPKMSKQDVSAAISRRKAEDPRAYGKACGQVAAADREAAEALRDLWERNGAANPPLSSGDNPKWRNSPEGRAATRLLKKWTRLTEADDVFGIVVYRDPDTATVHVDVARVSGADLDHHPVRGIHVVLDLSLPRQSRESRTGWKTLEWSHNLGWFPATEVLLWHKLHESFVDVDECIVDHNASSEDRKQLKRYLAAVEKGKLLARQKGLI
jgi:hypothetical protein